MSARVAAAIEQNRPRIWAVCYRMTGRRADADDLAQEAAARAIERAEQALGDDPTGWLLRLTARLCIDHLRRRKIERRVAELVDPLDDCANVFHAAERAPDCAAVLRQDVRFAVMVALQHLSARQRAAMILHDVCDVPLDEVAAALDTNRNAAKALLQRARVALRRARLRDDVDVPADRAVVERFAAAIEAGSIESLSALLAEDAWGVVDGGGVVTTARKPSFGRRAISRQWANARRRVGVAVTAEVVQLNGEPAVVIRLAAAPEVILAVVHFETRAGEVAALRVNRDPRSIASWSVPTGGSRSSFGA